MPNWLEAAATFWAVAFLGAVPVPIVHFYGPKEVGFILRQSGARVLVIADRFGHLDFLATLEQVRPELPALEHVFVVGPIHNIAYPAGADRSTCWRPRIRSTVRRPPTRRRRR